MGDGAAAETAPLRLVSYNIRHGGGRRVAFIGAVLAALEPDVVLLQEAVDPLAVERIAHASGLPHVLARPRWSVGAISRDPVEHEWHRPPRARGWLEVRPARAAGLRLLGLHLPAGLSARGERARMRSVEILLDWLGGAPPERTLLVGDLNSVARSDEPRVAAMPLWLRLLLHFDGGIRTEVQDRLAAEGWTDVYRHLHPDEPGFTLPAAEPQVRLDYVLAPPALVPGFRSCEPAADVAEVARASDHLPLLSIIDQPG